MNESPIQRGSIIALAPNNWDGLWMNRQQLLSRLASRGWAVQYSVGRLAYWDRGSDDWHNAPLRGKTKRSGAVYVDIPGKLELSWPRFKTLDRISLSRHAKRLVRGVFSDNWRPGTDRKRILYLFHPSFFDYVDLIPHDILVYHAYDSFSQAGDWDEGKAIQERRLVECADIVIESASGMIDLTGATTKRPVIELLNGADSAAFAAGHDAPCPDDLSMIPHPRIGYTGRLTLKMDFPLIAELARRERNWQFVLIGPITMPADLKDKRSEEIAAALAECQQLSNVHFLGQKPMDALPAYCAHMDVNTMCYRADEGWWSASYPLKLHEYLAVGKPVVSVELARCAEFADIIQFAKTPQDWHQALACALGDETTEASRLGVSIAMINTWDTRVSKLETCLIDAD